MIDYGELFRLDGRAAIVTGGARGIGAEVARALAQGGAKVLVTDVLAAQAEEVVSQIQANGGTACCMSHDVTDEAAWEAAIARALDELGGLDILVNNAGIEKTNLITALPLEELNEILAVNVEGTALGMKHAITAMRPDGPAGKGGSIINLSSVAGLIGAPGASAYGASKGAVRSMSRHVAVECGMLGIPVRVNSIHPGIVDTDMGRAVVGHMAADLGADPEELTAQYTEAHVIGRLGTVQDIAALVRFLASDASGWITGSEFAIDGGLTAH